MRKLAVLTAVVFLFGVAGFAMADDPLLQANNNDLVGAKGGSAVNDSSNVGNTNNVPIGNDQVKNVPGAAANDQSIAAKDNLNNNKVSDIANDKSNTANNNDLVKGGAAANDKSIAVKDTLNNNDLFSNNKTTVSGSANEVKEGGQLANNGGTNVKQEAGHITNVLVEPNAIPIDKSDSSVADSNNSDTSVGDKSLGANSGGSKNFSDNKTAEAEKGSAATVNGNAAVDSRDQSTHIKTDTEAEKGSVASTNNSGYVTLDKSTTINVSNVGLALQNSALSGKVEDNKLEVGGPRVDVDTKAGNAKTSAKSGKAESDEAKTGSAFAGSASKSKSGATGAAAFGGSASGGNSAGALSGSGSESEAASGVSAPGAAAAAGAGSGLGSEGAAAGSSQEAEATAKSDDSKAKSSAGAIAKDGNSKNSSEAEAKSGSSGSKSKADANSGNAISKATSGSASSGDAAGGAAYGSTVNASTVFTTGNNNFSTGSFNGVASFNVNTGVGSLQQSSINVNAVVGGSAFGGTK